MARRSMAALALAVAAVVVAAAVGAAAGVPYNHYQPDKFTVRGKVQCQDCTKNWNAYAYNARPIPGSVVGITCLDAKRRVVYHGTDATDGQGVFEIEVPAAVNGGRIDPGGCLVRLASSGDAGCDVFTDFNGGKTGEKPSHLTHVGPDKAAYAVGPYYYTLPQCDVKDDAACSQAKY